jgi:hypothetical protein
MKKISTLVLCVILMAATTSFAESLHDQQRDANHVANDHSLKSPSASILLAGNDSACLDKCEKNRDECEKTKSNLVCKGPYEKCVLACK